MPEASRTATMRDDLRRTPLFRSLVPAEAGLAYPAAVRRSPGWNGGVDVFARFAVFTSRRAFGGGAELFAPVMTVSADWRTGRIVEFVDLRLTQPWPPAGHRERIGRFPHAGLPATLGEYRELEEGLFARYDDLFDSLAAEDEFRGADELFTLLRRLVDPGLAPYLRTLFPEFFVDALGPGPVVG